MTRPGLTTATQPSGEPLPLPMRVSAGFFVYDLSGKTLIHTFPPRRILRVLAIRGVLAVHRDPGRLDLAVGDPAVLEGLDAVLAELHGRLALRLATAPAAVHL